jgi:DNA-directed RNA polymerase specialized sigma54-like protein
MEVTKEQATTIRDTIRSCVANESARDLATYSDTAIRELLRRKGVEVSIFNVGYYRQQMKIPGVPTRLRNLIEGGRP